jgi:hypothetical protein
MIRSPVRLVGDRRNAMRIDPKAPVVQGERPPTGQDAAPADWAEAHMVAAERLIEQSRQAVDRVSRRVQQTHRRVQRTAQHKADPHPDDPAEPATGLVVGRAATGHAGGDPAATDGLQRPWDGQWVATTRPRTRR